MHVTNQVYECMCNNFEEFRSFHIAFGQTYWMGKVHNAIRWQCNRHTQTIEEMAEICFRTCKSHWEMMQEMIQNEMAVMAQLDELDN